MNTNCKSVDKCNCVIENLLKTKFSVLSYSEKEKILKCGRPVPDLSITSQTKSFLRKFNVGQYEKTLWLTGCLQLKKLFCWPCILFNNELGTWNSNGFNDLSNMHKAIKRHENSTSHLVSALNLARFGKSPQIELSLNNEHKLTVGMHNEKVNQNRDVLKRLIDIVCYLGEQELVFRGYNKSLDSANEGNYVELINLIKKYDPFLESHLKESNVFSGLLNQIQNDLIDCVGKVLLNKIRNEINDSRYVTIILDETTNVKTTSVLSKMVRYVNKTGAICERFLGFTNVSADRTALGISQIVFDLVDDFNVGSKLIAQTCDGASVMSTELNELQMKVREKYPKAMFIYCMAHKLNLVLFQSIMHINECSQFFAKLKSFSLFFSKSTKRMYHLDTELKKRFPKVAHMFWNSNSCLVEIVLQYKVELIHLFQDIVDNSSNWDTETYTCAQALLSNLEDFDFNFLLSIFANIFPYTNVVFDIVQHKIYDISYCLNKINEMITTLQNKRDKFDEFWSQVKDLNLPIRRGKYSTVDTKATYKKLFIEILDSLTSSIEIRFHNLRNIRFLELLDPMKHKIYKKRFPDLAVKSLQDNYGAFFDSHRLKNELLVMYTDEELKVKPIPELLHYLKINKLDETLQELTKLCELALTLPATSVAVEHSFSNLKRIHTYAQNAQEEENLSSLALISIEKKLLKEIKTNAFYQQVIDLFNQENRRIELTYINNVCASTLLNQPRGIGGEGKTVEIDHTYFTKRKNEEGKMVPDQWVFGAICRETDEIFLQIIPDSMEDSIIECIKNNIKCGTTIISDCKPSYKNIENIEDYHYKHLMIINCKNVMERTSNINLQKMKNIWVILNERNKKHCGTNRKMFNSYISEFVWRRRYGNKDLFNNILNDIAASYSSKILPSTLGGKPSVNLENGKRKKRKRNDSEESLNLQECESSLQRIKTEENLDKEIVGMDSTTDMKVFCDAFPSNPLQTPGDDKDYDSENERTIPHHLQSQENSSGYDFSHSSSHFLGNNDEFMHSHEYVTEFDVFGKSVAKKLNSMPRNDALRLQQKMEEVMTNFELQTLSTPNNSSIEVPPLCEENFVDVKMEVTDDFIE